MKYLFILLALLLVLGPGMTHAETYYVAQTGNDAMSCTSAQSETTPKRTIAAGIGCLASSDTLRLKGGVYAEFIDQLIPSGTASAPTIIASDGDVVLRPPVGGNGGDAVRFRGGRSYITFKGSPGHLLVVDGTHVKNHVIRLSDAVHHITMEYIEAKNGAPNGNCVGVNGTGDELTHHLTIQHSSMHHCGTAGSNQFHGIYLRGADHLVQYNDVHHIPGGYGIHQWASASTGHRNVVRFNRVHDNAVIGILMGSGNGNAAYGNEAWNNGAIGISVGFAGATANQVANNTIYHNGGACLSVRNTATDTRIHNNICWENGLDGIADSGVRTVASHNLLDRDPLFVNAALGTFTLQLGSPAIECGINLGLPLLGTRGCGARGVERMLQPPTGLTIEVTP